MSQHCKQKIHRIPSSGLEIRLDKTTTSQAIIQYKSLPTYLCCPISDAIRVQKCVGSGLFSAKQKQPSHIQILFFTTTCFLESRILPDKNADDSYRDTIYTHTHTPTQIPLIELIINFLAAEKWKRRLKVVLT